MIKVVQLIENLKSLTQADIREILDIFGPCQGSIDIANHITSARNLIVESECQQCFDQTHVHQHD